MSDVIFCRPGFTLASVSGGVEHGPCVELVVGDQEVRLQAIDAKALMVKLESWLEQVGYDPNDSVGFWKCKVCDGRGQHCASASDGRDLVHAHVPCGKCGGQGISRREDRRGGR